MCVSVPFVSLRFICCIMQYFICPVIDCWLIRPAGIFLLCKVLWGTQDNEWTWTYINKIIVNWFCCDSVNVTPWCWTSTEELRLMLSVTESEFMCSVASCSAAFKGHNMVRVWLYKACRRVNALRASVCCTVVSIFYNLYKRKRTNIIWAGKGLFPLCIVRLWHL